MTGLAVDADQIASFVNALFRYGSPGQNDRRAILLLEAGEVYRIEDARTDLRRHRQLFAVYRRKSVDITVPAWGSGAN